MSRPTAAYGVTATIGVYGSASTWVFNVVRELAIAQHGADKVHAIFSDTLQKVLEDPQARDRHLVWKLHRPDKGWPLFAALTRARVILTVRDPRDAMLSMMQRFGSEMDAACAAVLQALRGIAENSASPHFGLRYESRFFDRPETVRDLACYLGLSVAEAEQRRIFETYRTERVRQFGLAIDTLPPERVKPVGDVSRYDVVTQIHHAHIGDQRIGKWRDQFDAEQRRIVNARFAPYLRAFGYESE